MIDYEWVKTLTYSVVRVVSYLSDTNSAATDDLDRSQAQQLSLEEEISSFEMLGIYKTINDLNKKMLRVSVFK